MFSLSSSKRRRAHALLVLAAALSVVGSARAQNPASEITLPSTRERVDADYPGSELAVRTVADVELLVVVDRQGAVSGATVASSGGPAFDAAALAAVQRWSFNPALRAGEPVASRIRVSFHFEPPAQPEPSSAPVEVARAAPATPGASSTTTPNAQARQAPSEIVVVGHASAPSRGASDYEVQIGKLAQVPHRDAASLLRLAPGVLLTSEGGTGHPYQIFLRGFDAREGQDIEFTIDGLPINEVGNPHGNGLADTHFIIPELVRTLRVVEGPFAPQQGNFAVAGSAAYDVGVAESGLTVQGTVGSFNTKRLLLTWHPAGGSEHTFGGAELFSSDGFGPNRAAQRATATGGFETALGPSTTLRLLASTYATHYAEAGVLRLDDVENGRKGFFDTYDTSQGGDSSRHSMAATLDNNSEGKRLSQSVFVTLRDFRLRQNLTGYLQDPQQTWQSEHPQRGDLIDQQSSTVTPPVNRREPVMQKLKFLPVFALALGATVVAGCGDDDDTTGGGAAGKGGTATEGGSKNEGGTQTKGGTASSESGSTGEGGAAAAAPAEFSPPADPGKAGFWVTVSGEDLASVGYDFVEGALADGDPPAFVDGWAVHFDHVIVTIGNVTLHEDPDKDDGNPQDVGALVAKAAGPWAVDAAIGGDVIGKSESPDEKTVASCGPTLRRLRDTGAVPHVVAAFSWPCQSLIKAGARGAKSASEYLPSSSKNAS